MSVKQNADNALKNMFQDIDSINIDDVKSEGVTIRVGKQIVKLEVVSDSPISIEDEIREEFRLKIKEKLQEIKVRLNTQIQSLVESTTQVKIEYERKERELKNKLRRAQPMPDIFLAQAERGLSVVKGERAEELIWLVQGVYWPKTYGDLARMKEIEPNYSKKMMTHIIFMIRTKGNTITKVSTHKPIGLAYFEHYHQQRPDCWGSWQHPTRWERPDDIIKVAKDAEAVLENINPYSIATHNPRGLPRQSTVERHLRPISSNRRNTTGGQDAIRMGANSNNTRFGDDVWTT